MPYVFYIFFIVVCEMVTKKGLKLIIPRLSAQGKDDSYSVVVTK